MSHQEDFEHEIRELQKSLNEQNIRLRTCMNENDNMRHRVASLKGGAFPEEIAFESIFLKQIAIKNGRLLSSQEMLHLDEEKYDVILNCVDRKLRPEKTPTGAPNWRNATASV